MTPALYVVARDEEEALAKARKGHFLDFLSANQIAAHRRDCPEIYEVRLTVVPVEEESDGK